MHSFRQTGVVHFGSLTEFTAEQYKIGLESKLMGQVNLVLTGLKYINEGGSFTDPADIVGYLVDIQSGYYDPLSPSVNGAIDSFVKSAAIEMPNQTRINSVSPTVFQKYMESYGPYFRGFEPVSASRAAALAFSRSVEGAQTGVIYRVGSKIKNKNV